MLAVVGVAVATGRAGPGLVEPSTNSSTRLTIIEAPITSLGMDAFGMRRGNSAAGGGRCGGRCGGAGVRDGLVRGCGLYVRTACIHFCWVVACMPLGGIIACTMALQVGKRCSGGLASARISGAASSAGSTPLGGGYF